VRVNGEVRAIRSRAGAVGLMQVNSRVWRGFYDPRFLLGDPAYNARAGSEILLRYYLDLAWAKGEQKRGGIDGLVRATYSAYNGGPSALARYRDERAHRRERSVDAAFFEKYKKVRSGRDLEVMRCFG
jgi:soluble lytic murein transglycosylase-like protein